MPGGKAFLLPLFGQFLFEATYHRKVDLTVILFVERWAENDKDAYYAALRAIIGWSVRDRVGGIRCPVLVVAADHDYTPVSAKEAYLPLMPRATLKVIADSRHATPMERPQAFNAALLDFLDTQTSR